MVVISSLLAFVGYNYYLKYGLSFSTYFILAICTVLIFYQLMRIFDLIAFQTSWIKVGEESVEFNAINPMKYGMLRNRYNIPYGKFKKLDIITTNIYGKKVLLLELELSISFNVHIGYGSSKNDLRELAGELARFIRPTARVQRFLGYTPEKEKSFAEVVISKTKDVATRKAKDFLNKKFGKGE